MHRTQGVAAITKKLIQTDKKYTNTQVPIKSSYTNIYCLVKHRSGLRMKRAINKHVMYAGAHEKKIREQEHKTPMQRMKFHQTCLS